MACDANASGEPVNGINILDILAIIDESFGNPSVLVPGQPDCNKDGMVNIIDILDTIAIAFP